jgi:hypothetical protein
MTTLERIDQLEKKLASMSGMIQLAAESTAQQPKILQELGAVRAYAKNIADALKTTVDQFNKAITNNTNFAQLGINRTLAVEQSLASLAKMAAALVAELSETKTLNNDNVVTRIRKIDEENEKERVQKMLESKTIAPAETASQTSLVVISEDVTTEEKGRVLVREYSACELTNADFPNEIRQALVGKKVGDVFDLKDEKHKETLHFKVLEVYELVPRKIAAPAPTPTPAPSAAGTQTGTPSTGAATGTPATSGATQVAPAQN